jgi:general secretion pathway protein A
MYKKFYGLTAYPFALTADPEFFYPSENHENCLRHALYSLEQGQGLIVITGEVGTGKTLILNTLTQSLGKKAHVAFLVHSKLDSLDILQYVTQEFGLETSGKSKVDLLINLKNFLLSGAMLDEKFILIIDEAQNLPVDVLEELRLLLDFEKYGKGLLQIILVGQLQLEDTLKLPKLTQLVQRIGSRHRLLPLNYSETKGYIEKRLSVAGATYPIFTERAIEQIFIHSQGIPRVISLICDLALTFGFRAEKSEILPIIITLAVKDLDLSVPQKPTVYRRMYRSRRAVVAGLVICSLLGVGVIWQNPLLRRKLREYMVVSVPEPLAVFPQRPVWREQPILPQRPVWREQPILPQRPVWREQPILPFGSGLHEPSQRVLWKHTTIAYQFPTDKPFIVPLSPLQHTSDNVPVKVTFEASDSMPLWLNFDPDTLTLSGMAPATATGKTYRLIFRAQTADGLDSRLELTLTMTARVSLLSN